MPKRNNTEPQLLREILEDEFDSDLYRDILRLSAVHKVSHKFISRNPNSFFNRLFSGQSRRPASAE